MPWAEALIRAQTKQKSQTHSDTGRMMSYSDALNEALTVAMEMDPKVWVLGQGVDDPHGSFGVTLGLAEKFGSERCTDTPLSEEGITGICTGAALGGTRPILFHNRPDFVLLSLNQIVTHAAKWSYMDNGKSKVPLVIWAAIGRGWGSGPQHSQAIHGMLLGVPGIRVAMPSTPADAKGIMLTAIADNNPVLIFEHRWLMKQQGDVPEGLHTVPVGKGVYRQRGTDLTIVGTSHMLHLAMDALENLKGKVSADVIDLRWLKPIDEEIVLESVKKTGRLLVVDTAWETGGLCAEIGCMVAEKGFNHLRAPVARLGLPDVPTPAGYSLEQLFYPKAENVEQEIINLCEFGERQ